METKKDKKEKKRLLLSGWKHKQLSYDICMFYHIFTKFLQFQQGETEAQQQDLEIREDGGEIKHFTDFYQVLYKIDLLRFQQPRFCLSQQYVMKPSHQ